ncbi:Lipase 3 [Orchesella cincta]|uniref:Lipase 3 n=1 Tax=Orchesella cincta TaxID=48709 RepID=A0A1D2MTW6_ORCCI|nr:Lipase 3 [Orchesella cincta]
MPGSCATQLVFSQRFPFLRRLQPLRVCRRHQPLPTNDTIEPFACQRELALASSVKDPEADKSIVQISQENGYIIQTHNVTTSDGYILTIFRISGGRRSPAREGKPAVLVLHGFANSCDSWIALPNDQNLAYMLVDDGYDVWLGCHRGTSFSLGHRTLNSNTDISFWDFSFHEMGLYDFTAMVDHVRVVSGNEKIFVIAHSQGAAAFIVATSEIPSMNEKIHACVSHGTCAYVGGTYEPLTSAVLPILGRPIEAKSFVQYTRRTILLRDTSGFTSALGIGRLDICQPKAIRCGVCDVYTLAPFISTPAQTNYTNLPRMIAKLLDTVTFRSLVHYGQNARSCSFRQYDFETEENFRRYGTADPPRYNLSRIQTPIHIFWGEQDAMVSPPDIQRLANDLSPGTLRAVIRVNDDTFQHLDFLVARDAKVLVYEPLLALMNEFLNRDSATDQ